MQRLRKDTSSGPFGLARFRAHASWAARLHDLVVIARGKAPDPIPNSEVKTLSADGTPS